MELKLVQNANSDPLLDRVLSDVRSISDLAPALLQEANDLHSLASRFAAYAEMSRAAFMLHALGCRLNSPALLAQAEVVFAQISSELKARPLLQVVSPDELQ